MVYLDVQRKLHKLKDNEEVYISLGSNKGDRFKALRSAVNAIKAFAQVEDASPIYETPPWGFNSKQEFLNAVVKIKTNLDPEKLLDRLLELEKEQGRYREIDMVGYQDRTIDLDILFYGKQIVQQKNLFIPHPRLEKRMFILKPLCDIAPNLYHPVIKRTIKQLLESTNDKTEIVRTSFHL